MWETVSKGTLGKWSMSVKGQMNKNKGCFIRHRHRWPNTHLNARVQRAPDWRQSAVIEVQNLRATLRFCDHKVLPWLGKLSRQDQSYQDVFYNFYRGVPSDQTNCRCFCVYANRALWMKVNLETIHHLPRGYTLPFSFPVATKSVSVWVRSISLVLIYTC